MFKKLAVAMVLILAAVTSANATVYYAPPSSVTVRQDPYASGAQAVGGLIGMMIRSEQQRKQQEAYQKFIDDTRQKAKETVEAAAENIKHSIENGKTLEEIFASLEKGIYEELMCNPRRYSDANGTESLSYIKDFPDGSKRFDEVSINTNTGLIRCMTKFIDPNGAIIVEDGATRDVSDFYARRREEEKLKQRVEELTQNVKTLAAAEVRALKADIDAKKNTKAALALLDKRIRTEEHCIPNKESSNAIDKLSYTKKNQDETAEYREYVVNRTTREIICTIRLAPYTIEVTEKLPFTSAK